LPGRPLDIQQGGDDPATRYIFDLLRELGQNTAQIGTIITPASGFSSDDVLVFDGAQWRAVDKAALLALDDLTDTIISAPATNHILRFNGVNWVNVSSIDLLALTDLSDVTISVRLTGHVLRYSGSAWVNVQLAELLA